MEINTKLQNALKAFGTIVLIVLAALPLYYNREKTTSLEIKKISEVELTRPLNVERLSSSYLYDSIPVEHLWQTAYVIKNIGETTIFGEGFENKSIRGNALKLHIKNCDNLLSVTITDTTTDAELINDSIKFTQWRPNEFIELLLLADGSRAPEISLNDRDIQKATISSVSYSPEEQLVKQRMMDKLPRALKNSLWWITIVVDVFLLVIVVYGTIDESIKIAHKRSPASNLIAFIWIALWLILSLLWMF